MMTDFSAKLKTLFELPAATAAALEELRDDSEIIASVTKVLHPEWDVGRAGQSGLLEDGRATWHGIVDELSHSRAALPAINKEDSTL